MSAARPAPIRIGVYGGTFNPIHLAHLVLAEDVRERLGLERVLFVPANLPPHKGEALPGGAERLALVRLAIRGNPGFGAIDLEVRRGGRSYTIDTLRALAGRRPGQRRNSIRPEPVEGQPVEGRLELFFLIGMDAFAEIRTWHEADRLAEAANFAVFPRAGHPLEDPRRHAPAAWDLRGERRLPGGLRVWRTGAGTGVWLVPTEELSISATAIRARAARGASIRYLVPPAVERAIVRGGLYRRGPARGRSAAPQHTKGA